MVISFQSVLLIIALLLIYSLSLTYRHGKQDGWNSYQSLNLKSYIKREKTM